MRVIISPAKKMRVDTDTFICNDLPVLLPKAEVLKEYIQSLSYAEQKALWACNDKIARENAGRYAHMNLREARTPAILAYDGIQYASMGPAIFEDSQFDYVQRHLRILSGFYGVLRPMDGVVPYRLEMQAKEGRIACIAKNASASLTVNAVRTAARGGRDKSCQTIPAT